jgi:hypothetical protein
VISSTSAARSGSASASPILADEMAADQTSDLGEAEGEGVSPEQFLGRSAFVLLHAAYDPDAVEATTDCPSPSQIRHRQRLRTRRGLYAARLNVTQLSRDGDRRPPTTTGAPTHRSVGADI